jgi:hypothetical protein
MKIQREMGMCGNNKDGDMHGKFRFSLIWVESE